MHNKFVLMRTGYTRTVCLLVYERTYDVAGTQTNPKFFINVLLKRVIVRQSQNGLFYTVTMS